MLKAEHGLPRLLECTELLLRVKVRLQRADNSTVRHHCSPERSSVPNSEEHHTTMMVDPNRLQQILQRLQANFYDGSPAAEQVAAAVLADLNDLEESPPVHSH